MNCTWIRGRLWRCLTAAAASAAIGSFGTLSCAAEPTASADTLVVALQPGDDDPRPRPERERREVDRRPEDRGPRDAGPRDRGPGDRGDRSPEARERDDRSPEERRPDGGGPRGFGGGFGGSFGGARGGGFSRSFEFRGPPEGRGFMEGPPPGMRGGGGIDARLNELNRKLDEVLREVRDLRRHGPPGPPLGAMRSQRMGPLPGHEFGPPPRGSMGPPRGPGGFGPPPRREGPPRERERADNRDDDRHDDDDRRDGDRPRGPHRGNDDLSF